MKLPIPVTVLTGFLGAGKTTILKSLLDRPELAGTAVIVNEFGEVGLDDALIEASDEETVMLPSGCICCAVRGDLVAALSRLADRAMGREIGPISRVVIETTGLADPAPIAHTLMTEESLFRFYQLDGIATAVDAELADRQIADHYEPAKQIAIADVIIVTKTDRAEESQLSTIDAQVRALAPRARVIHAEHGAIEPDALFDIAAFEPIAVREHAKQWLAAPTKSPNTDCHDPHCSDPGHDHSHAHSLTEHSAHGHLHGVTSFCLTFETPLDGRKLSFALELLRSMHGERLLRVKGIVNIAGEPAPFVVHGVQHVFYPPTTLEAWPDQDRRSRLVFITKALSETDVRKVLEPLLAPGDTQPNQQIYDG